MIQERDASGNTLATYTLGAYRVARTDSNGPLFYHVDGSGNVSALVNTEGYLKAKYVYDSFGNLIPESGPSADANLYRFASKEIHPILG